MIKVFSLFVIFHFRHSGFPYMEKKFSWLIDKKFISKQIAIENIHK